MPTEIETELKNLELEHCSQEDESISKNNSQKYSSYISAPNCFLFFLCCSFTQITAMVGWGQSGNLTTLFLGRHRPVFRAYTFASN